ncbi:hypothetical protein GCL60_08690 [Silvanigrella paludirubra]|uniref:Pilus formation protein N-terminal domain-containing protein n=1 Tax=Silvanigrella paludirubra TaxID=2499159 RepID=A0A6N6VXX2_9BACT|nr:hypothetical protein [Silvanigrella paludirubra]KAB8038925.1 hypothetical protein GCL60_08690 [Silvanigrella paludirubra]
MLKVIILFLNLMIFLKIFPNNFVERKEVQILFEKCKIVSQKKILEISIKNKDILDIENDYLSGRICLKAKKIGSTDVVMLLADGRGNIIWKVNVIQSVNHLKKKKKNCSTDKKMSKFDKDLKKFHQMSGWR